MAINFSILIPTYNRAKFLCEALESVVRQLLKDDEIIIVDDGSSDNTEKVIKPYLRDKRIKYFKKIHTNAPDTRNYAIKNASHDWLLWLDSDDVLLGHTLDLYRKCIRKYPDVSVVYGNIEKFGKADAKKKLIFNDYYKDNENFIADLIYKHCIPNNGTLFHKEVYLRCGKYDEKFVRAHDYEFSSRIAKSATVKNVNKTVCKWRWHEGNMSTALVNYDLSYDALVTVKMLRKYSLKELFPKFNWKNKTYALAKCNYQLSKIFVWRENYQLSFKHLKKAMNYQFVFEELKAYLNIMFKIEYEKRIIIGKFLSRAFTLDLLKRLNDRNDEYYLFMYRFASLHKELGNLKFSSELFHSLLRNAKNTIYDNYKGGAFFHLGEIEFLMKNKKKAKELFQKALFFMPEHHKAKEYLKTI